MLSKFERWKEEFPKVSPNKGFDSIHDKLPNSNRKFSQRIEPRICPALMRDSTESSIACILSHSLLR
jgi:hypothetical protein